MKAKQARIVLTGASGGIGQAAALAFVEAGAAVMLVGRSATQLSRQATELARSGCAAAPVDWHAADLAQPADIAALAAAATAWDANVIVHGAGLPSFGRLDDIPAQDMQRVLQTNLLAPMLLTQALLPHLRRLPRAQVICVGSAMGRIGLPGFSVYNASKFGLRGFAEALRRELADSAVQVQYFGPRSTRTAFNDAGVQAYNAATGTAMDAPERVAAALLRLLEDEAAERFMGYPEKLAVRLNGLVPTWLDRVFAPHRRSLPVPGAPAAVRAAAESPSLSPLP